MVTTTIAKSLERLRPADGPTDTELLAEYRDHQNGDAFAVLVRRYAPLVWSVCHHVVGEHHTAEDAFQATFMVLARNAGRIRRGHSVGSWLYGTAFRVALRARTKRGRRARRESLWPAPPEPAAPGRPEPTDPDTSRAVLEEVHRLPGKFRAPVVLCHLEGLTRQKAAARLGIPEGTLSSRLNRAGEVLKAQLIRRGLAPSAGVAGLLAAGTPAGAAVLPEVVSAAARLGTGNTLQVPASVSALADAEVRRAVFLGMTKLAARGIVSGGVLVAGVIWAGEREPEAALPGQPPTVVNRSLPAPEARPTPPPVATKTPAELESEVQRLESQAEPKKRAGDLKGAAALLRRAVAIRDKQRNADAAARDREALSHVLTKDGDLAGAADLLREAVLLWEVVPDDERAARTREALRDLLKKAGHKDEARAVLDAPKWERKRSLTEVWELLGNSP